MRPLLLVLVLLAAGCGSEVAPPPVETPRRAAPRSYDVDWRETFGGGRERLVFVVRGFAVTKDGWRAQVGIENRSSVAFRVGRAERAERTFGLMLFETGRLEDLEERARDGTLPPVREAQAFDPALPERLPPGAAWRGTMSARGALPAGLHLRLVFGRLIAEGEDVPEELAADVSWITDHAVRL